MIFSCFNFLRGWRIQTQVLFFQLLIISFITLIFGILIYINIKYSKSTLEEIQSKLLEDMQFQRLRQQSSSINQQSKQYLIYGFESLERINKLYQFSLKPINFTFYDGHLYCPIKSESSFLIENLPYFCYAYYNSTHPFEVGNDVGNQQLIHYLDLLNILLLKAGSADYQVLTYFTHINQSQFFANSPVHPFHPEYRPHNRPWFKNHIEQMNISHKDFQISDFYTSFVEELEQLTITRSLEDLNGQFQGVIGIDFLAEKMHLFHYSNALTLGRNGQILWQNSQSQLNYSIYDTEFTGFTLEDWEQIEKQANSKNGISNCQIQQSSFCRYNSQYKRDLILDVFNLFDKFYLIIYVDVVYLQENQVLVSQIQDEFLNTLVIYMIIYAVFSVVLLGATWFLIKAFLRPYSQLNEQTLESLFQKRTQKFGGKTKDVYSKINLQNFQSKIFQMKHTRSLECQKLEKFKYPKQSVELKKSIQNEITQLSNIPKSQNQVEFLQIYLQIMKQFEPKEDYMLNQELIKQVYFQREDIS